MTSNNTLSGYHIKGKDKNGLLKLNMLKKYNWHIPKNLREKNIEPGDIVKVKAANHITSVLVTDVFREEIEQTGRKYKPVMERVEKAPESAHE